MPYMYDTIRDLRSLIVYQKTKELVNKICKLSERFPLFSLLPEERATNEIIQGKLRKADLDYFAEHVNPKLSKLLAEEYGEDWKDFLANNYAETVVSDLNDIEEFKNEDYMDVEDYIGDIVIDNGWEESLS